MQENNRLEVLYAVVTILTNKLGGEVKITPADIMASQETPGSIATHPDGSITVKVGK